MKPFILSTEQINRYGFRVLTGGIDLKAFKANPVMFYLHNRTKLPIGTWDDIYINDKQQLVATPNFDELDPYAMEIKGKVDRGILKTASLNFNISDMSDEPEMLLKGQQFPTVTKCEAWEASIVDIPGNPGCMRLSYHGIEIGGDLSLSLDKIMTPILKANTLHMKKIAISLGLSETATEQEILSAIQSLEAKKEKTTATAENKAAVAPSLIDSLVSLGKARGTINDQNETNYRELAAGNFDATLKLLDATPAAAGKTEASTSGATSLGDALVKLNASNLGHTVELSGIPADRKDWSIRDWEKKDGKGLIKLNAAHPETYKKLFEAEYK